MGNFGSDTNLWDSCPLPLHFIPTSAPQCTAALLTPDKSPHPLHRVDEGKAVWGQLRRQHRAVAGTGGLGSDSLCWNCCLASSNYSPTKTAVSTGFSVQHNMGITSARSLSNEGLFSLSEMH